MFLSNDADLAIEVFMMEIKDSDENRIGITDLKKIPRIIRVSKKIYKITRPYPV